MLLRAHHMTTISGDESGDVLDVSGHPHIEDLMAIADILITDYSSIIYDFEATGRPAILYISDIEEYDQERGLIIDIFDKNYNVASSQEQLIESINKSWNSLAGVSKKYSTQKVDSLVNLLVCKTLGIACENKSNSEMAALEKGCK